MGSLAGSIWQTQSLDLTTVDAGTPVKKPNQKIKIKRFKVGYPDRLDSETTSSAATKMNVGAACATQTRLG